MYKLIIADDEQLEREAIKFIVNENFTGRFEIREAANGREALENVSSFMPDVIFLDIRMPGISGLETAAKINEMRPECRIIVVTAYHYFNYAKEALSLGVADYITKPAPVETVVAALQRVMDDIESTRAKQRLDEEKELRLKQLTQYFEDDLLVLIAYGEIDEKAIEEYFEILNTKYHTFLSVVASVNDQNWGGEAISEIRKRILKKNLVEWLKRYFIRENCHAFIRSIGREIYILLLFEERTDEYSFRVMGIEMFTVLKETLALEMQTSLSIGISNVCHSVHEINQAFQQAKNALRYETAPGSIVSFGDIQKGNNQTPYPINKERKILQSILQGDADSAVHCLDELMAWILENTVGLETFQLKMYELLLVLNRETATHTNMAEFNDNTEELRRQINFVRQKEEISRFAREHLVKMITDINAIKISRVNGLLAVAVDYMNENYPRDLSLEEVASHIQISPFYLSKVFKKEMGQNFIDYLTGIRIQKAKDFLTNPLMTVKDVCYQVGYKDPNYFARVFKKTCGLTPTEYQAKNMR